MRQILLFSRRKISGVFVLLCLLGLVSSATLAQLGAPLSGGGFVVFGRVNLPNGKPAAGAKVTLQMPNGLNKDTICDDGGNFEFRAVSGGRYHLKAENPNDPEQYSDPADSDSTRAYSNRVQVNIYLRPPLHAGTPKTNPGTVHVSEVAQNIPKSARKAYEQGMKQQKENQVDKAQVSFTQAVEIYPEYFQALTERANSLMQQNKLAEAEADFATALAINDKYSGAFRGLGYCQIQQKKFVEGLSNLEKSYALEPEVPLTLLLLGYANLSLDRYEEAKQSLQQAIKIGGDSTARAHVYLAEVFAHEKKFKEAADEIRAYLKMKPSAPDAVSLQKMEADWKAQASKK